MPDDEHRSGQLTQDSRMEARRDNLLKLLRLLAKEVAQRLACTTGGGDVAKRPRPK